MLGAVYLLRARAQHFSSMMNAETLGIQEKQREGGESGGECRASDDAVLAVTGLPNRASSGTTTASAGPAVLMNASMARP